MPAREHPDEYEVTGLSIDWSPYSGDFVLRLANATRIEPQGEFSDLLSSPEIRDGLADQLNNLAIWWRVQSAWQSRPTDKAVGSILHSASRQAEKLVTLLPVIWEDDTDIAADQNRSEPTGIARFAPVPGSCNPRLADAFQSAIEAHLREGDLDKTSHLLPEEWPADLVLNLRSFAQVLRRAADALLATDRKQAPTRHDAALTELVLELAALYTEIFGKAAAVSRTVEQEPSGPWIRFLGMILRELPGLEQISDRALENLTRRHIDKK